MKNGALGVAFLADLGDPQADRGPDRELVAEREGREIEAARGQVLGEGAGPERDGRGGAQALPLRLDVLDGQEGDLAVAEVDVRVALDAPAGPELDRGDRALDLPLLGACVDGDDRPRSGGGPDHFRLR